MIYFLKTFFLSFPLHHLLYSLSASRGRPVMASFDGCPYMANGACAYPPPPANEMYPCGPPPGYSHPCPPAPGRNCKQSHPNCCFSYSSHAKVHLSVLLPRRILYNSPTIWCLCCLHSPTSLFCSSWSTAPSWPRPPLFSSRWFSFVSTINRKFLPLFLQHLDFIIFHFLTLTNLSVENCPLDPLRELQLLLNLVNNTYGWLNEIVIFRTIVYNYLWMYC